MFLFLTQDGFTAYPELASLVQPLRGRDLGYLISNRAGLSKPIGEFVMFIDTIKTSQSTENNDFAHVTIMLYTSIR